MKHQYNPTLLFFSKTKSRLNGADSYLKYTKNVWYQSCSEYYPLDDFLGSCHPSLPYTLHSFSESWKCCTVWWLIFSVHFMKRSSFLTNAAHCTYMKKYFRTHIAVQLYIEWKWNIERVLFLFSLFVNRHRSFSSNHGEKASTKEFE